MTAALNADVLRSLRQSARRVIELEEKIAGLNADKAEIFKRLRAKDIDVPALKAVLNDRRKRQVDPEKFAARTDAYSALWLALEDIENPEKDEGEPSRTRARGENQASEKPAAAAPATAPREAADPVAAASRPPSSEPPPASDVPDIPDEFKRPTDKPHHVNPQPVPPPDDDDTYALFSDDPPAAAAAE